MVYVCTIGLILALGCQVSSLYQQSVVIIKSKVGGQRVPDKFSLSIRLAVVLVKGLNYSNTLQGAALLCLFLCVDMITVVHVLNMKSSQN